MSNEYKDWLRDQQEESNILTPERISNFLSLINNGWNKVPFMRFGQLVENLKQYIGKDDIFYIEDSEIEKYIRDYFNLYDTLNTYYQIVPLNDGYTYMGYENGKYVKCSKMEDRVDTSLIWKNKSNCEEYLKKHFDTTKYKVEEVWLDEKYYKFNTKD